MIKGVIPYQTTRPTPYVLSGVTFYRQTQYDGAAGQALPKWRYTRAQLAAHGVPGRWASSVRIPPGWKVVVYSGDHFTGTSWTLTSDSPYFPGLKPSASGKMLSCRIQ